MQLASGADSPVSVYDVGLDNRTEADGLAVGQASLFAAALMRLRVSGIFTVDDGTLYANLLAAKQTLHIDLEPSAAAVGGPAWIGRSAAGIEYARRHDIPMDAATHVVWTTGGLSCRRRSTRGFRIGRLAGAYEVYWHCLPIIGRVGPHTRLHFTNRRRRVLDNQRQPAAARAFSTCSRSRLRMPRSASSSDC